MGSSTQRARRVALAVVALLAAVGLTGCDRGMLGGSGDGSAATVLIPSDTWVRTTQGQDASVVRSRLAALRHAVERLREETGTGWVGRQDDVTGYLAELSGGSRVGSATEFMDEYGDDLFGVGSTALRLGRPDNDTVPGVASVRAEQVVGDVPVLDAALLFISAGGGSEHRLTEIRGRVFPDLTVDTTPQVGATAARRIAQRSSGGTAQGAPRLVVMPLGAGRLAWEVLVVTGSGGGTGLGSGRYYIDAATGELVSVRPASAEGRLAMPRVWHPGSHAAHSQDRVPAQALTGAEPDPSSVEISGENPIGGTLTGHGVRTDAGIQLRDTTTPTYDPETGRGGIITYDATGVKSEERLPGKLAISPETTIRDKEAMAAHALSRDIYDYYAGLGRQSWDDKGGSLVSSVHYGSADYCNSFFEPALAQPQMIYGAGCTTADGPQEVTEVEIDTAGHEITHGVTDTSAGLIYSGQSGALNESFSDYLGNVIGNKVKGTDSVAIFEGACTGYTEETEMCHPNPDGSLSLRYMLTGDTFDDYLRVLDAGYRLYRQGVADQDSGGVHLNSAIWNNALWSIRTQLAKIDNLPGNDSPLAQAFDKAVYGALATRLGPTAGFVDARTAVEQVIVDSGLDPVVLRVAREVFDANKICAGCSDVGSIKGQTVTASPQTQLQPAVSGDQIAWLDLSSGGDFSGFAGTARVGGGDPQLSTSPDTAQVGFAGDALVTLRFNGAITRTSEGSEEQLASVPFLPALAAGLAGSDAGAAWVTGSDSISFVHPDGQVSSESLPDLGGDNVVGLGTGGGVVGLGTDHGLVFRWAPGSQVTRIGKLPGSVVAVGAYGDNVLAVDDAGHAKMFTVDGRTYTLSDKASPFGATMSADYALWTQETGPLTSGVEEQGYFSDTDLFLLSLKSGKTYNMVTELGQQGFPSISGNRIAWQDAAFGGDDILTLELPSGL
jgi:hypothetical protein